MIADTSILRRPVVVPRRRLVLAKDVLLRGPVVLFVVAYIVYAGLGLYMTLHVHLVLGDAQSRLANAYFALWNAPAKLAAIGFFWPPLQTLVLIPFAAIRPLATSNAALPLSSALFAAGTVVVVDRTLALSRIHAGLRLAIVAAFGLNPIVLFYAGNGMAESLYLFLLASALAVFVRWLLVPRWHHLLHVGVLLALAILGRFEVSFWLPVLVVGIATVAALRGASFSTIEGSLLVVVVPVAYALGLWMFFNWVLIGDPVGFLHAGVGVAGGTGFVSAPVVHHVASGGPNAVARAWRALRLQFEVFPATYLIAVALLAFAILRRQIGGAVLAAVVLVNAVSAALWAAAGGAAIATHLRYNQRAMPLALLAIGWLLVSLPPRWRTWSAVAALVLVAGSIPLTTRTMLDYRNSLGERAFVKALTTGKSQDNVQQPAGTGIPVTQAQRMAQYIRTHVGGRDVILTDNAQTFGVMLADGRPDRYFDRVDFGDRRWRSVRDNPVGRVRYFLIQRLVTSARLARDLIVTRYPALVRGKPWPPFVRRVAYQTNKYALFSLYANGIEWAHRIWFTRPSLERYLTGHGSSWARWSAGHPAPARILEAQSRLR